MRRFLLIFLMAGFAAAQSAQHGKDIPAIARAAKGAVVSIVMSNKDGRPIAQGSGFLVSKDGHVVTNYHVVEHGTSAVIKFPDGAFFIVEGIVAFDKNRDVAIVKAHGEDFRTLNLGDSDRLQVGEEVVAIGNPLSLESTVSNGIVSGIRILEEQGGKFLQITAPISPGSSGGPLFNMVGEVIGITTSHLRGGENLNFAVPINDLKPMLVARFSKVHGFPDEEDASTAESTGDNARRSICTVIRTQMTTYLPQAPTLCDDTGYQRASVFSPMSVLAGGMRRAWSTALFQTLQAVAEDEPCQSGCAVSVSDSQMASRSMHYETYISKEQNAVRKDILLQLGGFASDQGYFSGWSQLLSGTKNELSGSAEGTESAAKSACENYIRLLRQDPDISDMLGSKSALIPALPACSVMLATDSSVYVLVDFPNTFMPSLGNFSDLLPKAFHFLDRYEGAVIFRGPWFKYDNGTIDRFFEEYSLHWLGFAHDEVSSGVRTDGLLLLLGGWVRHEGQMYPSTLFARDAEAGKIIIRETEVYRIAQSEPDARVQLTDGSEWRLSTVSLNKCTLKTGDYVSLFATKLAGGEKSTLRAKRGCDLNASLVRGW